MQFLDVSELLCFSCIYRFYNFYNFQEYFVISGYTNFKYSSSSFYFYNFYNFREIFYIIGLMTMLFSLQWIMTMTRNWFNKFTLIFFWIILIDSDWSTDVNYNNSFWKNDYWSQVEHFSTYITFSLFVICTTLVSAKIYEWTNENELIYQKLPLILIGRGCFCGQSFFYGLWYDDNYEE